MVAVEQPLDGFAHIGKQMPAVSHLHRTRSALGRALGVGPATITADDLNPWVLLEPGCECFSSAIWQEVYDALFSASRKVRESHYIIGTDTIPPL